MIIEKSKPTQSVSHEKTEPRISSSEDLKLCDSKRRKLALN